MWDDLRTKFVRRGIDVRRILICALLIIPINSWATGSHYVHGYYRRNGTYVAPHYQTNPDGNPYNNWSTKGNINPYTGQLGTKNPYGGGYYATPSPPQGYTGPQYLSPTPTVMAYPHLSAPNNLDWNAPVQIPIGLVTEAHENVQKTRKEGGMVGLQIMVNSCYSDSSKVILCMLEDLASYKMDLAMRGLFSKDIGHDPGPTVDYFSEQNVELRLDVESRGVFNTPFDFWSYYRNAPDLVWYPDDVYPWNAVNK